MNTSKGLSVIDYAYEILELAAEIEDWAEESKTGGWSTHQVAKNNRMATELRRIGSNLIVGKVK